MDERFKKAKVGLVPESQFDETRVMRAVTVLKDLLAEHGHQFATVTPVYKTIPPSSVEITFKIKEGPTVKVGKIAFDGNYNLSDRTLRDAMVNTKPIGIPHSIIPGKPACRARSTPASWMKTRSAFARHIATAATSRRRPARRRPTCATRAA